MSRSYRDISRWTTIRIVSRRIDTVSIYRRIVSSLEHIGQWATPHHRRLGGIGRVVPIGACSCLRRIGTLLGK